MMDDHPYREERWEERLWFSPVPFPGTTSTYFRGWMILASFTSFLILIGIWGLVTWPLTMMLIATCDVVWKSVQEAIDLELSENHHE